MKEYWERGIEAKRHLFLTWALGGGEWSIFTPRPLCLREITC